MNRGKELKEARLKTGRSLSYMGEKYGVSGCHLSYWEKEKVKIKDFDFYGLIELYKSIEPKINKSELNSRANKVKQARIKAEVTIKGASESLGFSTSKIFSIESGNSKIKEPDFLNILDHYNSISISDSAKTPIEIRGKLIKAAREFKGFERQGLSNVCKCSKASLRLWEQGLRPLKNDRLNYILNFLGVTVEQAKALAKDKGLI